MLKSYLVKNFAMKTSNKICHPIFAFGLLLGAIFLNACTTVYLKKPVPQGGTALTEIPAGWAGVYIEEPETGAEASIYRHCIRFERLSPTRLFVTEEVRIRASDMPRWKQELDSLKTSGTLTDYMLTDRFLMTVEPVNDTTRPEVRAERQITRIFRQDEWYVLGATAKPMMLLDLEQSALTGFDVQKGVANNDRMIPDADSVALSDIRLVARQNRQGYFLNQLTKPDGNLWELYYLEQPSPDELVVKTSVLKNKEHFEKRLKHYNAITPFAQSNDGNAYIIDPSDKALEQLLADDELFHVTRLRKIGGE